MCLKKTFIGFIILCYAITLHSSISGQKPRVLFLHYPTQQITGIGVYLINCGKLLKERNYVTPFLVIKDSKFEKELEKNHLPFQTITLNNYKKAETLASTICHVCKELNINVICCNWFDQSITAAKSVATKLHISIIFIDHMNITTNQKTKTALSGIDGILCVNPSTTAALSIKYITTPRIVPIPPFFDENKFLNFILSERYRKLKTDQARTLFFRETFGIATQKLPLICMIANMYGDKSKNHPLLFQAIHQMVYNKNKPIEVMLAGDGAMRPKLEQLANALKIKKYVHFLGFTDRIPELLYFTDFHVLSSRHEAFGIVHMEAAFMQKVSVGAAGTGATAIIKDGVTGLLFENNNVRDLVGKIEFLIDHPDICNEMGKSAYEHALLNFSNNAKTQAFENFLYHVVNH